MHHMLRPGAPMETVVQAYLDYQRLQRNAAARTLVSYQARLKDFTARIARRRGVALVETDSITADEIVAYLGDYATAEVSYRYTLLSTLASFFTFARRKRVRPDNPTDEIDRPKLRKRPPDVPTPAAVARVLDAPWGRPWPGWRDRALWELLYGTGIRISEGCGLTLDRLDTTRWIVHVLGKGNQERRLPVPIRAQRALTAYLACRASLVQVWASRGQPDRPTVFVGVHWKPLRPNGARTTMMARCKRLGLPYIRPHRMRAAYATHLLAGGADLRTAQRLLGHASPETTMHYLGDVEMAQLTEAVTKAHPRAKDGVA